MAAITFVDSTGGLFKVDKARSKNIDEPLVKTKPLEVVGTFIPATAGKYKFTATLTFDGGAPTPVSTSEAQAIAVDVTGVLDSGFPAEMVFKDVKDVGFTFTNSTKLSIAVTNLEKVEAANKGTLGDLTYSIIKLDGNVNVKKDVALAQFSSEGTLQAGHKIVVKGQYTAPAVAVELKDGDVGLKLSYGKGKTAEAWVKTKVIALVITPMASTLPDTIEVGEPQDVTFTFTNDTDYEAKNVTITITREPADKG
jgi:hypothetical protein